MKKAHWSRSPDATRIRNILSTKCGHPSWCKGLTTETDERLKQSGIKGSITKKGSVPWNKGLTKEVDIRVAQNGINSSKTKKCKGVRIWNKGLTKKIDERVKRYADAKIGKIRHINYFRVKSGFREDIGHYVRSSWEANVARVLNYSNLPYEYEKTCFMLSNGKTYRPDFKIVDSNIFIEVKGYMRIDSKEKIEMFKKEYPQYQLWFMDGEGYKFFISLNRDVPNLEGIKNAC